MNPYELFIPALSRSLSSTNPLPGLIFAVVVTALIGFVVGRLWGRAWDNAWTPWRSAPSAIVVSAFMVIIFGSLLTLHGLSGERFGFASPEDIPSATMLEHSIQAGDHKGLDARTALQQDGLFTPEVELCWNYAVSQISEKIPQQQAEREQYNQSCPDNREQMEIEAQTWLEEYLFVSVNQYMTAYYTALFLLLFSVVVMMLTVAGMAYRAIPSIPIHPELARYCSGDDYQA